MKRNSSKYLFPLLFVLASLTLVLAACGPLDLSGASGGGGSDCAAENSDGDNDFCVSLDGNSGTWSVPASNYVIYDFVIKAGTEDFGAVEGCYEVSMTTTSVTWNKVGSGPECKDISHVEVYYRAMPTPTPPPVPYCRADGDPYPYSVVTAKLDPATNLPVGFNAAKGDLYPVPPGGCPEEPVPVLYCRADGDPYPYSVVEVLLDPTTNLPTGFNAAKGDIYPVPTGGCPPEPPDVTYCRADGDPFPYSVVTVKLDLNTNLPVGFNAAKGDLYPVPAEGCPEEPPDVKYCRADGDPFPYSIALAPLDETTNLPVGFNAEKGDIYPVPADGCPQDQNKVPFCRAEGNPYPYSVVTVSFNENTQLPVGFNAAKGDIYPVPEGGCPYEPPTCPQFLIFHTFRDENLEIYRLDGVEGDPEATLINLTQSDAVDCRPSRSPDDAWLVYQSDRNENVELYITDLAGSGTTLRLTNTTSNNINPMFGPDNLTVAFQSDRNGNWDIFLTDLNTTDERQLTSGTFDEVNPFWSPDLRYLAYQSNRNGNWDIFILDTETGNETTLVAGVTDEIYPAWSPNGQQIAFLRNDGGVWNLYIIDATGENLIQITDGDGDTTNATWSPEGYRIAYQSERNGNLDVYTYDLRTGTEYRLTDYEGPDSGPTWDCGGSNIAFTSTRDGNPNILQVPWQGGSQSNMTIDPATDKWSEWSPTKEPASRGY